MLYLGEQNEVFFFYKEAVRDEEVKTGYLKPTPKVTEQVKKGIETQHEIKLGILNFENLDVKIHHRRNSSFNR